jgi:hypothetical protein
MNVEYSISRKNIFEHVWIIILGIFIIPMIVVVFNYKYGTQDITSHIIIASSILIITTILPILVLHIQYYIKNTDTHLKIDYNSGSIFVKQKGNILEFSFDDIKYMRRVKELEYARRRTYFLPWGLFNYSVLYLDDNSKIVITSYMVIDFDLPIDENKKKLFEVFYPFIV